MRNGLGNNILLSLIRCGVSRHLVLPSTCLSGILRSGPSADARFVPRPVAIVTQTASRECGVVYARGLRWCRRSDILGASFDMT